MKCFLSLSINDSNVTDMKFKMINWVWGDYNKKNNKINTIIKESEIAIFESNRE